MSHPKKEGRQGSATIFSLPDELLLKIIKIAAEDGSGNSNDETIETNDESGWFAAHPHKKLHVPSRPACCRYNHRMVANVICEISARFNRVARDGSLWRCDMSKFFPIPHSDATMESLPDTVLLKIFDAVSAISAKQRKEDFLYHTKYVRDHGYLVDIISQVSKQFKRIAGDISLWSGSVFVRLPSDFECTKVWDEHRRETNQSGPPKNLFSKADAERVKHLLIREYLNADTESIIFNTPPPSGGWHYHTGMGIDFHLVLTSGDLEALAKRCPNLKSIQDSGAFSTGLLHLTSWPRVASFSWSSMEELYLHKTLWEPELFKNVQLHHSLPNLKIIDVVDAKSTELIFSLPDMSGLEKLQNVSLRGKFHIPKNFEEGVPFPSCLEKLSIKHAAFYKDTVKTAFYDHGFFTIRALEAMFKDDKQIPRRQVVDVIEEYLPECHVEFLITQPWKTQGW